MTEPTNTTSTSRELARWLSLAAVLSCFAPGLGRAQAVNAGEAPAVLAKYDLNRNGVLDARELATKAADEARGVATPRDEVLELTPFAVTGDRDVGYIAGDSLAGSRLNTSLKDTAASLTILTKEFLEDIGATNVADAMAWSTNSQLSAGDTLALASSSDDVNGTFFGFNAFRVRGLPATQTRNYFEWVLPTDLYNSERIEEARGPNSILFGIGSAGGVTNTTTKRASLARDIRSATVGLSTNGGYRGTIDVNERFGRRLALRFNGVYSKTEGNRNFNFEQKQLAHLAALFKVSDQTTLRAEYETGRIHDNVGTNQQATDVFGRWIAGGSKLITTPITTAQNATFGVTRLAATPRVTYIGNSGTLLNLANQYASSGDDYVLPESVVPYTVSVGGPGTLRRPHFDTVTVAVEQQFGRHTFLELAYNHQQFQTFNQQVNTGHRLFIDPNATLPTGQANPNAGKYYVESESWAWNYGERDDMTRLSLAHELDLGKWGNYRFAAMGEYDFRSRKQALMFEVWEDHPYAAAYESQSNVVVRRQYVNPGEADTFYYQNPMAFGLIKGLVDPVTGRTLNSTWIPRNAANVRDNPEKQKSLLLATQARYFKERLVLGVGLRIDKLDTLTRGTTRDADGLFVSDYAANTFAHYEGKTKTLGAVFHLTKNISVFYNRSDNFGLPPNIFIVPTGERATNPEGQGMDTGIAVSLFDGKLYARANYFKTDMVNNANSNYGSTTNNPAIIGNQILDAAIAAGQITAAEANSHRVVGNGATYAQLVEGYEFNLTANPSRNWRLQANYSYTDGYTSNVAPEIQAWAAREIPFFQKFNQSLVTSNGTIAERITSFLDYHSQQMAFQGQALPGNRKHKANVFATYSFTDGMLKGLRVGGGYRHQSKLPIGQYADGTLQYGPSFWDSSAMIGYRFSKAPVEFIKRLSLQLNVNNVFDKYDVTVTRRDPATERVRRVVVKEGRTWRLTASFDF
jgi:iron complex outermembrane receptor protein